MIQKQALNLSKSKMKAHSQLLPIVCNENDTVILGITQYYAALELQYPNIEIVNMKGLNYEQELFYPYLDYLVSNNLSMLKQIRMFDSYCTHQSLLFKKSSSVKRVLGNQHCLRLCDLASKPAAHIQNGFYFFSMFETGSSGINIETIKTDASMVGVFCDSLCYTLLNLIGICFNNEDWCICTTPRRRHKTGMHFASEICEETSKRLGIPFYRDVVIAKNRGRITPSFSLQINPTENNIVLFDDILTTGIIIQETRKLLITQGHTVIPIIGIRNKGSNRSGK